MNKKKIEGISHLPVLVGGPLKAKSLSIKESAEITSPELPNGERRYNHEILGVIGRSISSTELYVADLPSLERGIEKDKVRTLDSRVVESYKTIRR